MDKDKFYLPKDFTYDAEKIDNFNEVAGDFEEKLGLDFRWENETTLEEFRERAQHLLELAEDIRNEKNPAYSGDQDYHENFKSVAREMDSRPITAAAFQFWKHIKAVLTYAKDDEINQAEPMEGRFADCINYILIMYSLYKEEQKFSKKDK